jgi:tRNA-2-methylthio-N6-dimethylallyladenosine synthase
MGGAQPLSITMNDGKKSDKIALNVTVLPVSLPRPVPVSTYNWAYLNFAPTKADPEAAVADLAVSTDIIVGFPGESVSDLQRSLEVAAAAEYDYAYTFVFSPREGTEAAAMVDHFVDPAVVAERFQRLQVVVEHSALLKHQARIGRVEELVVEGPSKKDPSVMSGRTRQNKLVHFTPTHPLRVGSYATVEVVSAAPHHLMGRFLELVAEPVHRRRIAVSAG